MFINRDFVTVLESNTTVLGVTDIVASSVLVVDYCRTYDHSCSLFVARDIDNNIVWGLRHDDAVDPESFSVSYDLAVVSDEFDRLEAMMAAELLEEFGGDIEDAASVLRGESASDTVSYSYDSIPF